MKAKNTVVWAMATLLPAVPMLSNCASDAQMKSIAEREGITLEEAYKRQGKAIEDTEEAIPGSISGFGHGD
jgi:hypothetical protein